jgi:hypothetical protein
MSDLDGVNPYEPPRTMGEAAPAPAGGAAGPVRPGSRAVRVVGLWTYGEACVVGLFVLASGMVTMVSGRSWLAGSLEQPDLADFFLERFLLFPALVVLLLAVGWALSRLDGWGMLARAVLSMFVTLGILIESHHDVMYFESAIEFLTKYPQLEVPKVIFYTAKFLALFGHAALAVGLLRLKPHFREGWAWSVAGPPLPAVGRDAKVLTPVVACVLAVGTCSAAHALILNALGIAGIHLSSH